jgi:hypothetical protein
VPKALRPWRSQAVHTRTICLHGAPRPRPSAADTQHGEAAHSRVWPGVASLQTSGLDILGVIGGGRGISIGEYALQLLSAEDDALQGAIADSSTDGFSDRGESILSWLLWRGIRSSSLTAKKQTAYPVRQGSRSKDGMTRIVTQDTSWRLPLR